MGIFSKKVDDNILRTNLIFDDGIDMFFKGELIELSFDEKEKKVTIQSRFENKKTKEKPTAHLSIEKINRAQFISETEIKEKSKSVGGRAVVGGLLLGPLGAVVGGISGVGDKKKKEIKNYVVINYNEGKVLTFEIPALNLDFRKVLQGINNNIQTETEIEL